MSKIVFLDIDGVLQPYGASSRFDYGIERAVDEVSIRFGDDAYRHMDCYDVAAAKCDWSPSAMGELIRILDRTGAEVVIESDWRLFNDLHELRLLFQIWEADSYVLDSLPKGNKEDVIRQYLEEHDDVDEYVVIDDIRLAGFEDRQVLTHDFMTGEDANKAIRILEKQQ